MFGKWLEKRRARKQLKDKLKGAKARMRKLDAAIEKLFARNQVIPSIRSVDVLVDTYIKCDAQWEVDYCRTSLKAKYRSAGLRYDDERLK